MSDFEQQRRQKLIDEDFYPYVQKRITWLMERFIKDMRSVDDPFMEPMIDLHYQQLCLDYTVGKPIEDLIPQMEMIMEYTRQSIDCLKRYNLKHPKKQIDITLLKKDFETEILSNLLGISILFERQDWFQQIVKGGDAGDEIYQENTERALDSLIAMKIDGYPITEERSSRELSFRTPLYKAIHSKTAQGTLKYLDEYLERWYDGLRKTGYGYIDSHLDQQGNARRYCSFYGYWCFEAAAVAYLKEVDDSTLHRFIYYPKDMIEYARSQR